MQIKYLNKVVGELRQDKIFVSHRDESHIFRIFNGLGLSYSVIQKLKNLGCWKIIFLLERKNGVTEKLITHPDKFLDEGILWKDVNEDYQRILPLHKFVQPKLMEIVR